MVACYRTPVVITKKGQPAAKLVPPVRDGFVLDRQSTEIGAKISRGTRCRSTKRGQVVLSP
jgi:antitoxin (DNA-binding transcriptional repressor) of toxin-antitoxin stability system